MAIEKIEAVNRERLEELVGRRVCYTLKGRLPGARSPPILATVRECRETEVCFDTIGYIAENMRKRNHPYQDIVDVYRIE